MGSLLRFTQERLKTKSHCKPAGKAVKWSLLYIVLFKFIVDYNQVKSSLRKHPESVLVGVVTFLADNPFDACVYYHHCTGSARCHLTVQSCALQGDAKPCSLDDSVLFRVKCPHAMLADFVVESDNLAHVMSNIVAMR
jgi:hypothetical protein